MKRTKVPDRMLDGCMERCEEWLRKVDEVQRRQPMKAVQKAEEAIVPEPVVAEPIKTEPVAPPAKTPKRVIKSAPVDKEAMTKYISQKAAADMFGITAGLLGYWIKKGLIVGDGLVGDTVLLRKDYVEQLLQQAKDGTHPYLYYGLKTRHYKGERGGK